MANKISKLKFSNVTYDLADEYSRAAINNLEGQLEATRVDLNNMRAAVGSPLTAAIISAMTDNNKIYVYTGTTTTVSGVTFTAGNWYYHDGTKWQLGGTYNETALETDTTLKLSGRAADAKVVGDALEDIIADEYDSTKTYSVGEYCLYNEKLYKCTTEISVAENFTSGHWTLVNVIGEVAGLNEALVEFNASNLILDGAVFVSRTHKGVAYTWDADNQNCTVVGTADGTSFANIYTNTSGFPQKIRAGGTYLVEFESTDSNIAVEFLFHGAPDAESPRRLRASGRITIPTSAVGLTVRLRVLDGIYANGVISGFGIFDAYSNQELSDFADNIKGCVNTNAHMLSVGNSILTGSVWVNGAFDHLAAYENTPYGNVATALDVPQKNVNHILLSNTGLISDGGGTARFWIISRQQTCPGTIICLLIFGSTIWPQQSHLAA